jgi:hypothetical protein
MIPTLSQLDLRLQPASRPCYGSRLGFLVLPPSTGCPHPSWLLKRAIFLRNIFTLKCHEQFSRLAARASVLCFSLLAFSAFPQTAPPFIPPPVPTEQPSVANPNLRLKIQRPEAPGVNDVDVRADSQEVDGDLRHLRGHVVLQTFDKKLEADEVDYNEDTKDAEARGNVRFENFTDGTKLIADHLTYNVDTETGIFYDVNGIFPTKIISRPGYLTTTNPFYFEAK